MKSPCVYILCNRPYGTLYVGVTSNLAQRMERHVRGVYDGFTKRCRVARLVYYELHSTMEVAITQEKRLKRWRRAWKYRIIEEMNPQWQDLFDISTGAVRFGPADVERLMGEPDRE